MQYMYLSEEWKWRFLSVGKEVNVFILKNKYRSIF
jgi:hypothetical protein